MYSSTVNTTVHMTENLGIYLQNLVGNRFHVTQASSVIESASNAER